MGEKKNGIIRNLPESEFTRLNVSREDRKKTGKTSCEQGCGHSVLSSLWALMWSHLNYIISCVLLSVSHVDRACGHRDTDMARALPCPQDYKEFLWPG